MRAWDVVLEDITAKVFACGSSTPSSKCSSPSRGPWPLYKDVKIEPFSCLIELLSKTPVVMDQRRQSTCAPDGTALKARLKNLLFSKMEGRWQVAVNLLDAGRKEGIKDIDAYNMVLKVPLKRTTPLRSRLILPHFAWWIDDYEFCLKQFLA